ncbi:MAG: sensor histidine kinase [Lishizhenia sp.]
MNLYSNKQKWKIFLLFIALLLVGASLFISNKIVSKVAERERERVTQWADAIKKRAELVKLTNRSFSELREKERAEMELWIDATKEISKATNLNNPQSYDLPFKIINRNKKIPVILLDQQNNVSAHINLDITEQDLSKALPNYPKEKIRQIFTDSLVKMAKSWEKINPSFTIEVYDDLFMTYYFNDSKNISRLEFERDSLIQSFNKELIENPSLVPVILINEATNEVIAHNLSAEKIDTTTLAKTLNELEKTNPPIRINFGANASSLVYYDDSPELKQLQYFPYIQFLIIGLFILIGYLIFSTFRKAEQNQVWAGMAKETAHQLGTPLSSLMAWNQLLQGLDIDPSIPLEMNKDINRLTQVTDRFSKIGSGAKLEDLDLVFTVKEMVDYLKTRISNKVEFSFNTSHPEIIIPHNRSLFEWVIENICKNAVDAMEGVGELTVSIQKENNNVNIDIIDSGKGMTIKQQRAVFQPGFTTKKRGWGLGLSLVKRIIKDYHKGRVFVLKSEIDKGTTFRIILNV